MSGHTPGPWEVINSTGVFSALGADSGDGTPADSTDGWNICDCSVGVTTVYGEYVELGFDVQKANARLVSAAPDLRAVAEKAIAWYAQHEFDTTGERGEYNMFDEEPEFVTCARAAIAKVKGVQP